MKKIIFSWKFFRSGPLIGNYDKIWQDLFQYNIGDSAFWINIIKATLCIFRKRVGFQQSRMGYFPLHHRRQKIMKNYIEKDDTGDVNLKAQLVLEFSLQILRGKTVKY